VEFRKVPFDYQVIDGQLRKVNLGIEISIGAVGMLGAYANHRPTFVRRNVSDELADFINRFLNGSDFGHAIWLVFRNHDGSL